MLTKPDRLTTESKQSSRLRNVWAWQQAHFYKTIINFAIWTCWLTKLKESITHVTHAKINNEYTNSLTIQFNIYCIMSNHIYADIAPVIIPVILTLKTALSTRCPRCLFGRVDSSALSPRVIFPSARSPNITPIKAIVAHKAWGRVR